MNITTKFTVVTEQGMAALLMLTKALTIQKFSSLLDQETIDRYINEKLNERALAAEVNSMSNQWLVVYVDDKPAGYARLTVKGLKPAVLDNKRAIRIADFGVLSTYSDLAVKDALLNKCLAVCKPYEGIWINEYVGNPFIELFESKGFTRQSAAFLLDELPLPSVCLIA